MKRIVLSLCAVLVAVLLFGGCEKKKHYAYPPKYGKAELYYPIPAHAGDTLRLRVQVLEAGDYLYKATYTWKIDGKVVGTFDVLDPLYSMPEFHFIEEKGVLASKDLAPGSHTISVQAQFKTSTPTESGQVYCSASASGEFKIFD